MSKAKLVMVTCYDATFAKILAESGALDYLLVGDSLGMVIHGDQSTTKVNLDQMLWHVEAVRNGLGAAKAERLPFLVADMPIGTYENDPAEALKNAERLINAGADGVKVEGAVFDSIKTIRQKEIWVAAHIGLTPQTAKKFKVQGRSPEEATRLTSEARALEKAGANLLVMELVPETVASAITQDLGIPTIGIGAGKGCSGQVLVIYDLLGLNPEFKPKFLRTFSDGYGFIQSAVKDYSTAVRSEAYPQQEHSF